eukprot:5413299-Amphidinium_carterae.1
MPRSTHPNLTMCPVTTANPRKDIMPEASKQQKEEQQQEQAEASPQSTLVDQKDQFLVIRPGCNRFAADNTSM